jgi:hypothetical protein
MYIEPSQIDDMIMKKRRDAGLSEVKRRPHHNRSLLSVDSGGAGKNNNSAMSLYQQSENDSSYQSKYF